MVERINRKIIVEIRDALRDNILEPVMHNLQESGELRNLIKKVKGRKTDPYSVAEEIAERLLK